MKALKICAQVIFICLLLGLPTIANAELQGKIYGDDVVTEDGESFNVGELIKALDDGDVDKAESLYNDFYKRRQEMLKRGTQFGILDLYLKHCHAMILYKQGDYKACIDTEDEVLAYLRAHLNEGNEKNSNWIEMIYSDLKLKKSSYNKLQDYNNSLAVQKDIVEFLEQRLPDDNPNLLEQKQLLASDYYAINNHKKVIEICEELNPKFEKVFGENDEKMLKNYFLLINEYHYFLRDYVKMGVLLNRAVPLVEKNLPDNSYIKSGILMEQAHYYAFTNQHQKSLALCERLLTMPIANDLKTMLLYRMADIYRMLNDYSNALKYILQAWDIYEKNYPENIVIRSGLLGMMSDIHSEIGNYQVSIRYAQEAFDLIIKYYGFDDNEVFRSRNHLAYCYSNMKQPDKALELYKENYTLAIKLYGNDNPKHIYPMQDIAWQYYMLGDYESSISWAKKALDESIRILGEKDSETQILWNTLAILYASNENTLDESINLFEKLLKEYSESADTKDVNIEFYTRNLAIAYSKSNRWKEAIPLFEKVIEIQENRDYDSLTNDEKGSMFSDQSSTYNLSALLYCRDNHFKDAFRTLERGRSRILIDSYSEQIVKSSGVLDKKEIAKLNEYKAGLANYDNLINAAFQSGDEQARFNLETEQRNLSDEYVKYKESLKNKYPKYKIISQANKIDIERDKNILPADTAFVDFMVGDKYVMAFIFDNSGDVKAVKFTVPEKFFEKCNFYRELLSYQNLETMQNANVFLYKFPDGSYKLTNGANIQRGSGAERVKDNETFLTLKKNLSKEIGDALFSPLAEYISKYPNLIIAPDKDLNNIPFETLEFNGKPAIESFNMSYVPSFSVLKLMHEAGEKNSKLTNRRDLYAMGNAFYGDNDADAANRSLENFLRGQRGEIAVNQFRNLKWKNLPGTKEEIDRVAEIFGNKKIFTEKSASETNLKASNQRDELAKYKYLLFSTHGLFDPNAPEYNSIVLSQGVDTKEDGYVTVGEWAGMNLNSDVVFLSACETGLGEYQAGEGIIGLPYALTIAGNKNTVMSLWEVQDKYAPEFVSTFFKKMKEGKTAFIAINETKREFLKHKDTMYRDPSVWSAFVLYGF